MTSCTLLVPSRSCKRTWTPVWVYSRDPNYLCPARESSISLFFSREGDSESWYAPHHRGPNFPRASPLGLGKFNTAHFLPEWACGERARWWRYRGDKPLPRWWGCLVMPSQHQSCKKTGESQGEMWLLNFPQCNTGYAFLLQQHTHWTCVIFTHIISAPP